MTKRLAKLGPGLMLAAAAVGVSHLVQSTRAGADFGLSFVWLIVLISLLKYPAFRFAIDYASLTGRSLVHGYARLGRVPLYWALVAFLVDMFIATAAVALVTAGLLISVFGLPFSGPRVAIGVVVVTALILLNGRYTKAERVVKTLVIVFSLLTITAMLIALPLLGEGGRDLFAEITPSRSLAVFVIAMTGWMPMPMSGALFISMWAREKRAASADPISHRTAITDLHIGWFLMIVLALSFTIMGAAILFQTDREVPATVGAFATELLSLFTTVIGDWSYPLIAIAAIAVMWSTVVALMDVLPRVTARLFGQLANKTDVAASSYTTFLLIQTAGVALIMLLLMRNFATFIDFATSAGFITAPAIAWYNYKAIRSVGAGPDTAPSRSLLAWHWTGLAALSVFALAFVIERLT